MKKPATKPRPTAVQEEMVALGTIVNLMKQLDLGARKRVVDYLHNRFGGNYC